MIEQGRFESFGDRLRVFLGVRGRSTLLMVLVLASISFLALIPLGQSRGQVYQGDKIIHALAFIVLFTLGYLSIHFDFLPKSSPVSRKALGWNAILWAAYGALIEIAQGMTGFRDASLGDFLADVAGIFLGILFVFKSGIISKRG